jgi:hypothetical protein
MIRRVCAGIPSAGVAVLLEENNKRLKLRIRAWNELTVIACRHCP